MMMLTMMMLLVLVQMPAFLSRGVVVVVVGCLVVVVVGDIQRVSLVWCALPVERPGELPSTLALALIPRLTPALALVRKTTQGSPYPQQHQ